MNGAFLTVWLRLPRISVGLPDPVIVVHSLDQAVAALRAAARAGHKIVLSSAPDAGGYLGPGWFRALVGAAREAVPGARFAALLDCGDSAGAALAAIRAEVEGVIFTGPPETAHRLADIARQHGVHFETERPTVALDLMEDFFNLEETLEQHCAEFLRGAPLRRDGPDPAAGHQHFDREGRDRADCADDREPEGCEQHRGDG
jgi:hypothetical protein